MRVINFGSLNMDYVYQVEHFVRPGETVAAGIMNVFPGGKGLNQSIALSRAGADVCHAGYYGKGGEALHNLLTEEGVDTRYLSECSDNQGQAIIQIDAQGQNSIIIYAGSNARMNESRIDEILSQCADDDIVLLQNEVSNTAYTIDRAHEKGLKVIFNPSPFDETVSRIDFNKVWWLIINEVEGREITGKREYGDILAELRNRYPNTNVALTKGRDGVTCVCGETVVEHGIFEVPVVDTTAAGDTFTGYFIAGIVAGEDLEAAVRQASVASSLCVSRAGAAPSIPSRGEVVKAASRLTASK